MPNAARTTSTGSLRHFSTLLSAAHSAGSALEGAGDGQRHLAFTHIAAGEVKDGVAPLQHDLVRPSPVAKERFRGLVKFPAADFYKHPGSALSFPPQVGPGTGPAPNTPSPGRPGCGGR